MQAARRVLTSVGILQRMTTLERRGMTTAAQLAADAAKPKGSLVDQLGVYILTPIALGVFAYDVWIADEPEFDGEIPPYPYMRIRTRQTFPWGTDLGPFEVHQHVHPLDS